MKRVIPVILCLLPALFFLIACEPVTDTSSQTNPEMTEPLSAIPASYGELESVTVMPEYPGWFQLWFTDSQGTIRVVRVQPSLELMHKEVTIIPRTGVMPTATVEEGDES